MAPEPMSETRERIWNAFMGTTPDKKDDFRANSLNRALPANTDTGKHPLQTNHETGGGCVLKSTLPQSCERSSFCNHLASIHATGCLELLTAAAAGEGLQGALARLRALEGNEPLSVADCRQALDNIHVFAPAPSLTRNLNPNGSRTTPFVRL
eukprot:1190174-Prorocentrum_minimum.AAC.2